MSPRSRKARVVVSSVFWGMVFSPVLNRCTTRPAETLMGAVLYSIALVATGSFVLAFGVETPRVFKGHFLFWAFLCGPASGLFWMVVTRTAMMKYGFRVGMTAASWLEKYTRVANGLPHSLMQLAWHEGRM